MRGAGIETDASGLIVAEAVCLSVTFWFGTSVPVVQLCDWLGELIPFLDHHDPSRAWCGVLSDPEGNLDLPVGRNRATATHLTETGTSTDPARLLIN